MQSSPDGYTFGWNGIGAWNVIFGGSIGYVAGKRRCARKYAPVFYSPEGGWLVRTLSLSLYVCGGGIKERSEGKGKAGERDTDKLRADRQIDIPP